MSARKAMRKIVERAEAKGLKPKPDGDDLVIRVGDLELSIASDEDGEQFLIRIGPLDMAAIEKVIQWAPTVARYLG